MSNQINRIARYYTEQLHAERGLVKTAHAGIALITAAIICAATRPDIANAFIGFMTGK